MMGLIRTMANAMGGRARRAVPYSLSGLIATAVNFGTLYILFGMFSVAGVAAATAAFAAATAVNFLLQKFWTYRDRDARAIPRQLGLFLLASLLMLLVNDAVFYALADMAHVGYFFAEGAATAAVGVVGFLAIQRVFAPVLRSR